MGAWGVVIFVLSVMRVVGGVPLWVECVSLCRWFVSDVYPELLFRVRCFVSSVVC